MYTDLDLIVTDRGFVRDACNVARELRLLHDWRVYSDGHGSFRFVIIVRGGADDADLLRRVIMAAFPGKVIGRNGRCWLRTTRPTTGHVSGERAAQTRPNG